MCLTQDPDAGCIMNAWQAWAADTQHIQTPIFVLFCEHMQSALSNDRLTIKTHKHWELCLELEIRPSVSTAGPSAVTDGIPAYSCKLVQRKRRQAGFWFLSSSACASKIVQLMSKPLCEPTSFPPQSCQVPGLQTDCRESQPAQSHQGHTSDSAP